MKRSFVENESVHVAQDVYKSGRKLRQNFDVINALASPRNSRNIHDDF